MNENGDIELKKFFIPLTNKKVFWMLFIIGFVVFGNMLFNKFVWDDRAFIEFNPDVLKLDIPYLLGANMFNNIDAGHYRFLPGLYLTIFHHIFGNNVFFYHTFQLVFHIISTFMIYLLMSKFVKKSIAFFVGLIFLVHPMQVESVSYVASIDSVLFSIICVGALLLNTQDKISYKGITAIFGMMFLALLAKETAVISLMLIVLYRIFFHKNYRLLFPALTIAIFLPYLYIRLIYANVWFSHISLAPIARLEFTERLLNIPGVVFYYLKTFVWPMKLSIIQFWIMEKMDFNSFYFPLLSLLIFIGLALYFGRRLYVKNKIDFKLFVFFSVWLVVGVGLYSHLFHLDMTVSDRWFYFPIIGILGMIALILKLYLPFLLKNKQLFIILGVLIIGIFSIRTIVRNTNWADPLTLYAHDSKVYENYDLENNLGGELNLVGRKAEAFSHFEKSVRLFPHESNLFNLAAGYQTKGDSQNAIKHFQWALDAKSYGQVAKPHKHQSLTYERLASLLMKEDPKRCLEITKIGLSDHPESAQLWYSQALCHYKLGNKPEALNSSKKAYELVPDNPFTSSVYKGLSEGKELTIE